VADSNDVLAYYETGVEVDRLAHGAGALELTRTKELLARHLEPGSRVADVGGGPGVYADWLADAAHRVVLVDPVGAHVETARTLAGEPARFETRLGDARRLPFADASFDAVLLLGPLYHLGERAQRLEAVSEAARVTRPAGLVIAAAICRYAGLFHALRDGRLGARTVLENVVDEVRSGRRVPPSRRGAPFADAFFHLPEELRDELVAGGLSVEALYGVEGPGVLLPDLDRRWEDQGARSELLRAARDAETDPHLILLSAHLLAVSRTTSSRPTAAAAESRGQSRPAHQRPTSLESSPRRRQAQAASTATW
jgi:SAM-dependent methyltransferase